MGNFFIVQGSTEPGATVTVNGETVEVGGDGSFNKTVALTREGWNTIVIRAIDPAGNTTEHRESVLVEVTDAHGLVVLLVALLVRSRG